MMEFIQKKSADSIVEYYLSKAAESGISLVWDRYEGQLPECGFCETGLSCRDCLQGPCISHPFRDSNKLGVCGKDKDTFASQSLLRLVIKGTMTYLDRLCDFGKEVESGKVKPKNKNKTDQVLKAIQALLRDGGKEVTKEIPRPLLRRWEETGIIPEGVARDLFKASQKLEGGMTGVEETLLWAFKSSLLGYLAHRLYGHLKKSVFGDSAPIKVEVNLGVLKKAAPNVLLYGPLSPVLKMKIAEAGKKNGLFVTGVCTDPLVPSFTFPPVTNYASQEIPLMTGAVDLIVAADQFVNPSLSEIAKQYEVPILPADSLNKERDPNRFARLVVDRALTSFDFRRNIPRDIPDVKEYAFMGFSPKDLEVKKILDAITKEKIKGIAILTGSNNVKYTQDKETVTLAQAFVKNDILCLSKGEASVTLGKYGFLNSNSKEKHCSKSLSELLSSLGKEIPSIIDVGGGESNALSDVLISLGTVGRKELKDLPVVACFPEANRSSEVVEAMWMVAMGVSTYFWPCLPLTGSGKAMAALSQFCEEKFGSTFHVITEKKIEAPAKANLIINALKGEPPPRLSGQPWK
jgi:carbon-monoxide dehydrogenase catalytic subunit